MKRYGLSTLILVTLAGLLASGCWSSTRFQTAQTLDPGEVTFGMGFSAINIQDVCAEVEVDDVGTTDRQCASSGSDELSSLWIPNLLPDLFMRFGIYDNLDIGFKLLFLGIQGDVKYQLLATEKLHLSIGPGVRLTFPFMFMREYALDLPVLFTADFGAIQLYAAIAGSIGMWTIPFQEEIDTDVTTSGFNGVLGLSFGNRTWYVRPEVGYTQNFLLATSGDSATTDVDMAWLHAGLGFGFLFGGED